MPRAVDRRTPDDDHSPLRGLLDFDSVTDTANRAGSRINLAFDSFAKLFGLTGFLDILDGNANGTFNPQGVVTNFFNTLIKPLADFGDAIKAPLRDLITILVTVLDLIPIIGPPAGDALEYFGQIFGVMRDKTSTAQSTGDAAQVAADNANVGVARLEGKDAAGDVPGGIYFSDTFDRTSTSSLGSNYDQASSGAPTGALQTEGNNAWWNVGGSGQGTRFARITTPLFTIYQGVQIVLNSKIANLNLVDPHVRIVLRCNAARTSYVYVDLQYDTVQAFKVISGSTTSLGSAVPLPTPSAAGDRWTFKAGTDVSDDEFVVIQNTAEALRVTDSGTLAGKGAGYEYTGFVLVNGQIQVGFGNTVQDPPKVQSITAYDRLPAA